MTNFTNTTTKKGTHVSNREHTAKSTSHRTGFFATLSNLFRGQGTSAPSRSRALLAVLALAIAAFAISAAPASAAPLAAKMETISNVSYTSAHVTGKLSSPCKAICSTNYTFQYATSESGPWTPGPGGSFFAFAFPGGLENQPVQGDFEQAQGLKGGTKYFVRLTASTFVGGESLEATDPTAPPYQSFTTLAVDPPTIPGAVEASPIFSTSAAAIAKVKRPANADAAFDVNCHFEYITDAQFLANEGNGDPGFTGAEPVPCTENPVDKDDVDAEREAKVTAPLTGLSPATAYRLRLVAENAAPGVVTKDATFTTAAKVAAPAVLATDDATDVSYKTATLTGEVERPAGADPALDANCRFEYITDAQFLANEGNSEPGFTGATPIDCDINPVKSSDPTPTEVKASPTGLKSGVKYHLRLVVENTGGTDTKEATNTFTTTPGGDVVVTTDPISDIGYTTAQVSGTITSGIDPEVAGYSFGYAEVGTEDWIEPGVKHPNAGCFEPSDFCPPIAPGSGPRNVSFEVTGLKPATEYKFRLNWINAATGFFTPSPEPYPTATTRPLEAPTATLDPVTTFTGTSAHFSATVDTHAPAGPLDAFAKAAYKTEWHFECTPECPPSGNLSGTIQGEEGSKAISVDVTHLEGDTHYEVKLLAHNEVYSAETPLQSFDTPLIKPTIKALPGGSDGKGGYVLQGTVNPNNSPISDCTFAWGPEGHEELDEYAFQADCSPMPAAGIDEVQQIGFSAVAGQFRLSYRNQTTGDIEFNAPPEVVEAELEALSVIGAGNVTVTGSAQSYKVEFSGSLAETNVATIKGMPGTVPLVPPFAASAAINVTTIVPGGNAKPVTVEAPLTGLTPDAIYNFRIFATNAAGTEKSENLTFKPTLAVKDNCPNEQLRKENNSLALPECRAYEKVTPSGKEGFSASLKRFDGGDHVAYISGAGNIAKSGQSIATANKYVAARTAAGWETIPNLNGSSGSFRGAPSFVAAAGANLFAYSSDLLSSLWTFPRKGDPPGFNFYLRNPDGTFTFIAPPHGAAGSEMAGSADLSHFVLWTGSAGGALVWGPGVYDFVGTGVAQPRRVDVDNLGSPISTCTYPIQGGGGFNASGQFISNDGRVIVVSVAGLCGGANPPAEEIWARVGGTTSVDVSASRCDRAAADPGGACNGPVGDGACSNAPNGEAGPGCRNLRFQGAAKDGSRVFFTTKRQLLDADTDETADLYACDIPAGTPTPVEKANHCSTLRQVSSGALTGADVESVGTTSEDGSTVLFTAEGVLADNEDALKEKAVAGDHNLYLWRTDASHPDGQTAFVARLDSNDLVDPSSSARPQATSDGRYLVFTTASQLVATDTDNARDIYRYDVDTHDLTRASTNVFGVAGNGDGFDAAINPQRDPQQHPIQGDHSAVSNDGQKIVFATTEPLSPADGNGQPDVYLWTPKGVFLISTGAAGGGATPGEPTAAIDGSGADIYFQTAAALTPADGDDLTDVYDARIGGGFSFVPPPICTGEECQPPASGPLVAPAPATAQPPAEPGNVKPKTCPKGKVLKKNGKCVKKPSKKHSGGKHHGKNHKRAGSNGGGGK